MPFIMRTVSGTTDTPDNTNDEKVLRFTNASPSTLNLEDDATNSWVAGTVISGLGENNTVTIDPVTGVNVDGSNSTRVMQAGKIFTLLNPNGDDEWFLVAGDVDITSDYSLDQLTAAAANYDMNLQMFTDLVGIEWEYDADSGTSFTPAVNNDQIHLLDATGNATINAPTGEASSGKISTLTMFLRQDSSGSRTWTLNSAFVPAGGVAPTFSTGANDVDIVNAITFDGGSEWFYWLVGSFAS